MGCGEFLVKYILFFANLFFALAGLALLGLGIAVELRVSKVIDAIDEVGFVQFTPIGAMVIGSFVFIVAFFGCCGAIRESNCMLVSYAIIVIIMMVLKIVLATLIFVKQSSILESIPRWLTDIFNQDRTAFQEIERAFSCCGPAGAVSYLVGIPDTCCSTPPCTLLNSFDGCNTVVADFFETFALAIAVVAIVVVSIELVAVVFGLCLANHVRNKSRRSRY